MPQPPFPVVAVPNQYVILREELGMSPNANCVQHILVKNDKKQKQRQHESVLELEITCNWVLSIVKYQGHFYHSKASTFTFFYHSNGCLCMNKKYPNIEVAFLAQFNPTWTYLLQFIQFWLKQEQNKGICVANCCY